MHENELYGKYLEDYVKYKPSQCSEICFQIQVSQRQREMLYFSGIHIINVWFRGRTLSGYIFKARGNELFSVKRGQLI